MRLNNLDKNCNLRLKKSCTDLASCEEIEFLQFSSFGAQNLEEEQKKMRKNTDRKTMRNDDKDE